MRLLAMKIRSLIARIGLRFCRNKKYLNDADYLIDLGRFRLGYTMDLNHPKTFNEKLNWYKLNYRNDLMTLCTDKYEVRKYVESKGLKDILLNCYGVYDSFDQINIDTLPDKFVVKATGDSGGVVICRDKNKLKELAGNKFDNFNVDYSKLFKEWNYQNIKNRIIVDELIDTKDENAPNDYKIFCFHGEPKFLFVASERNIDVKFDFYDLDWNLIDVLQGHNRSKNGIEKPKNFDKMLEIARNLSKDFPHVRVDLYNVEGKIYFGELTFFHFAGMTPFYPRKFDDIFGEYFDINKAV